MTLESRLTQMTTAALPNFYKDMAAKSTQTIKGLPPNYFSHYYVDIQKGYYNITKAVRDSNGEKISPFNPEDIFGLKDRAGNYVSHQFKGLRGMPIGYFVGAKLGNYEQALEGEKLGAHCQVSKAALDPNGANLITQGYLPLQSSIGIPYSFRAYQKDPEAPGVYAPKNYVTWGTCSPEFAELKQRPIEMSCVECIKQNLDRHGKNVCRTNAVLVFYVTHFQYRSQTGYNWISVEDLGCFDPEVQGIVVVIQLNGTDLRGSMETKGSPLVNLTKQANSHVPPDAKTAHLYIQNLYKSIEPESKFLSLETEYGPLYTLAAVTEVNLAELAVKTGSSNYVSLYREVLPDLDATTRHGILDRALDAYFKEKEAKSSDYETLTVETAETNVPISLEQAKVIADELFY